MDLRSYGAALITGFNKGDYGAGTQNWSVAVDSRGFVYLGNNDGLLEYDGARWSLYPMPNRTVVRSVYISSEKRNRIYVGAFEEFGYFEEDQYGQKHYYSLSQYVPPADILNNEIWRIHEADSQIYFQSFSTLFVFNGSHHSIIRPEYSYVLLQKARGRLFVHVAGVGLCEIVDHTCKLLEGGELFRDNEVRLVLPKDSSDFLIGTTSGGLFVYNNETFVHWNIPLNQELSASQINNGLIMGDNYYLGTIVNGLFVIDEKGQLVEHIHSGNGLNNNTILGLAADRNHNIWLALDRGINHIDFGSPMIPYIDRTGATGAVYSAVLKAGKLYVGTNQGLLLYNQHTDGHFRRKGFIKGLQGQVWELASFDNHILCGHTEGTFLIEDETAVKISETKGGFCLKPLPALEQSLLQSTYGGLVLYEKNQGRWEFSRYLPGFNATLPFMETDPFGGIWVNQLVKGTYHLRLNERADSIIDSRSYGKDKGFPGEYNIRVSKIDERIVFATREKIYTWDDLNDTILPYTKLNNKLGLFSAAEKIIPAPGDLYWFISHDRAGLFRINRETVDLLYQVNLNILGISFAPLFPHIVPLNDSISLFCLENGFYLFNLKKVRPGSAPEIILRSAFSFSNRMEENPFPLESPGRIFTTSYKYNNFSLTIALVSASVLPARFAVKIDGIDDRWSDWTTDPRITLRRIQPGSYTLRIKVEDSNANTAESEYFLVVSPPWFRSTSAYVLYIVVMLTGLYIMRMLFLSRLKMHQLKIEEKEQQQRQQEQLIAEQQYVKLQNEKLDNEISFKNAQLANTTMSLIRKNELLIELKDELGKYKIEFGNRYPQRLYENMQKLIEKDLTNDDHWKIFETHFDQAHQNFFKRLKNSYPDLTPNDLKLSAYLKLNLTTKEIAPLFNISIRGVEVHRYRLRKRLGLESDQNLVEFLMNF